MEAIYLPDEIHHVRVILVQPCGVLEAKEKPIFGDFEKLSHQFKTNIPGTLKGIA